MSEPGAGPRSCGFAAPHRVRSGSGDKYLLNGNTQMYPQRPGRRRPGDLRKMQNRHHRFPHREVLKASPTAQKLDKLACAARHLRAGVPRLRVAAENVLARDGKGVRSSCPARLRARGAGWAEPLASWRLPRRGHPPMCTSASSFGPPIGVIPAHAGKARDHVHPPFRPAALTCCRRAGAGIETKPHRRMPRARSSTPKKRP